MPIYLVSYLHGLLCLPVADPSCPTNPPLLGIIWGYSGDLTYPDVKCPIVGQIECVKSPNAALHKSQLQHGDLTWLHILKALSIYAFIKCPIVGQ